MSKRKVKIVEPERHCLKPNIEAASHYFGRKRVPPLKVLYGQPISLYGMCPEDQPYLNYKDGLYCCQANRPSLEETYAYYNDIMQNIEEHEPGAEQVRHWKGWSGRPTTFEQEMDIAEVVPARKRNYTKDMRWLKSQFEAAGQGARVKQWAQENLMALTGQLPCESLKESHCRSRRDCEYDGLTCKKQQISASQLQRMQSQERQRMQEEERHLRQYQQLIQALEQQEADEFALMALMQEEEEERLKQRRQNKQSRQ